MKVDNIYDKVFYLDENHCLKENHEYMFQVEAEMAAAEVNYSDFMCWIQKSFVVVRVTRDLDFMEKHMPALKAFLKFSLLPQLLSTKAIPTVQKNSS